MALLIALILATGYLLLIGYYALGWHRLALFSPDPTFKPDLYFTVLVPACNEAAVIERCLTAISECVYPAEKMEILVLDNGSTDETATLTLNWIAAHPHCNVQVISLPLPGKKAAITAGVARASGTHIVCTDADCEPPPQWLALIAQAFVRKNALLIAGPVVMHREKRILGWFQSLDLLGLMGITGSGIHFKWQNMANGANLAYTKTIFQDVNGFDNNAHIASGDDLFLVQKVAKHAPSKVFFLKNPDAAVATLAMPTWHQLVRQRIRWGSKNAALPEWPVRLSLLWVLLTCWTMVIQGALSFWNTSYYLPAALLFFSKMAADGFFLVGMSRFFRKTTAMRWFFPAYVVHTLYIVFIGIASLIYRPRQW